MRRGLRTRSNPRPAMVLAALLSVVGCDGEPPAAEVVELPVETDTGTLRNGTTAVLADGESRPDTISGALVLRGERRSVTFRLFRSPPGFLPAFSAYVPEDMTVSAALVDTVRFVLERSRHGRHPMLEVVALPAEVDEGAARRALAEGFTEVELPVERADLHPGAVTSHLFSGPGFSGRSDLVEHDGRYVILRLHYPPEDAERIVPRTDAIRDTWIWSVGSAPLVRGLAPIPENVVVDTTRTAADGDTDEREGD